ncbi:MAG: hypothetical protein ACK55Z_02320, partial [bacterium]
PSHQVTKSPRQCSKQQYTGADMSRQLEHWQQQILNPIHTTWEAAIYLNGFMGPVDTNVTAK